MDLFSKNAWRKEQEARQLVRRGHATFKELLILNYGEWPLRGLNIVTDDHLDVEVSLAPMHRYFARKIKQPNTGFFGRLQNVLQAVSDATRFRARFEYRRARHISKHAQN